MSNTPDINKTLVGQIKALQEETRTELTSRFEAEAKQNIADGRVWMWGAWVPKSEVDHVRAAAVRRGRVVFLETQVGLGLIFLTSVAVMIVGFMFLSPYPIFPRKNMPLQFDQAAVDKKISDAARR